MATLALKDPKQIVADHVAVLREYARRLMLDGDNLTEAEEADRASRVQEFLAIGSSFKLTRREMVVLVYKQILAPKPSCGCPTCRKRAAR